jgi:hypothetical protein
MPLHDTIKSDAKAVFCNASDFAEKIVYIPRSGKSRNLDAVVIRDQLGILPEDGDVVLPSFEIHVANNIVGGIASDELDLGGDMLVFSVRVGDPPERRSITRLISHDEGMLVLQCR